MVDKNKDGKDDRTGKRIGPGASMDPRDAWPAVSGKNPFVEFGNFMGEVGANLNKGRDFARSTAPGSGMPGLTRSTLGQRASAPKPTGSANPLTGLPSMPQENPMVNQPSIADILGDLMSQAGALLPGQVNAPYTDFSSVRGDAERVAGQNRAYLDSIYGQLGREIDNQNATIDQRYAGTGQALQGITNNAATETKAAYDSATEERNRLLASLGIQDAAAQQVVQGTDTNLQGANAQEQIQDRGAIAQTANTQAGAADSVYNQRIGQASRFAGAEAQRALSDSLASRLAEISQAEAENRSSVDAQNADAQNGRLSQQMSIVDMLRSLEEQEYGRSQDAAEFAAENAPQAAAPDLTQEFLNDLIGYGQVSSGLSQANPTLAQLLQDGDGLDKYLSYKNQRRRFG